MRPSADFSEEILQVRQEWNDTAKALIKKKETANQDYAYQNCPSERGDIWTSLVVQWVRIHLPILGTGVRPLVQEDPTYCGATESTQRIY